MQLLRLIVLTITSLLTAMAAQIPAAGAALPPSEPGTTARAATNMVVRGPRDSATERALNPFLKFQTNERGEVLFDYQYQSTNSITPPDQPTIEVHPEGATATGARHAVHFTGNLMDEEAVVITMPDQRVLQGRVVALSLVDGKGHRQWLGEIQDCQGHLVAGRNDQVLYADAFQGIQADVLFTYDFNSVQQDILIREQPVLSPELDPGSARVEVWSKFLRFPSRRE